MLILAMRTDKVKAELYLYKGGACIGEYSWEAHRQLSNTLDDKITELLNNSNKKYADLDGLIVYEGPGSFTGLRIGFSVANAIGYSLQIPIIASGGESWNTPNIVVKNEPFVPAHPVYGSEPNITKPRK